MQKTILIIEDEPINLTILANLFTPAFLVRVCRSGDEALKLLATGPNPDLVLLDILMPGLDGFDTLARIHADPRTHDIPVIFISALDSDVDEDRGFRLGAVDYITKPFRPAIVMARVRVHLELKQAKDALKNQNQWLESEVTRRLEENELFQDAFLVAMTQLAETRDEVTGHHIERTSRYVERLACSLQQQPQFAQVLDDRTVALIVKAAPLHDIGKIGIPDPILLKPGKLTPEEFSIIQTHCQIGATTLRNAINKSFGHLAAADPAEKTYSLTFLEQAEAIALYHHERWDGSGYPHGLKGEAIPLSARLMALADVFDALTTARPYKQPWSMDQAAAHIIAEKGRHFDPDVVVAFEREQATFASILRSLSDC